MDSRIRMTAIVAAASGHVDGSALGRLGAAPSDRIRGFVRPKELAASWIARAQVGRGREWGGADLEIGE